MNESRRRSNVRAKVAANEAALRALQREREIHSACLQLWWDGRRSWWTRNLCVPPKELSPPILRSATVSVFARGADGRHARGATVETSRARRALSIALTSSEAQRRGIGDRAAAEKWGAL